MKITKWLAAAALVTATIATPALAQDRAGRDQAQVRANQQQIVDRDSPDDGLFRSSARYEVNDSWNRGDGSRDNWNRSDTGFWPGDFAANVVGSAVGTAGAIATAPFRGGDSFASYDNRVTNEVWNDSYRNSYAGRAARSYRGAVPPNNGSWATNNVTASYAARNGFVCQPGTYFTGKDGREHICQ